MNEFLEIQDFCDHTIENKQSNEIEFVWADPRDIFFLIIEYQSSVIGLKENKTNNIIDNIQYWQANWPKNRPSSINDTGSGSSGWKRQDDWYKGTWITANHIVEPLAVENLHNKEIREIKIHFSELSHQEIPDENFPVAYRRTLKLKIKFSKFFNLHQITNMRIFTPSRISLIKIKIDWDPNKISIIQGNQDYDVSVFNGILIRKSPIIELYHSISEIGNSFDQTLLTIKFKEIKLLRCMDRFTISIQDLLEHGFIFSPDLGILIQLEDGSLRIEELIAKFRKMHSIYEPTNQNKSPNNLFSRSIYDRIFELPEQSYQNAMNEFKDKHRLYGVIGCEGVRSKCAITETGNLSVAKEFIQRNKGADTEKVYWNKKYSRIKLDWLINERPIPIDCLKRPINRNRLEGYFPIFESQWNDVENQISIRQITFASPISGYNLEKSLEPDSDLVTLMQLSIENKNKEKLKIDLAVTIGEIQQLSQQEEDPSFIFNKITIQQSHNSYNCICSKEENLPFNRSYIFSLELSNNDPSRLNFIPKEKAQLAISIKLSPKEKISLIFKFPMLSLIPSIKNFNEDHFIARVNDLMGLNFSHELDLLKLYWNRFIKSSGIIEVPNEEFSFFFKAQLIHVLITNDREIGCHRIFGRVGALGYGTYANEVCMIVQDLDRKGLFEYSRNILETFIKYQGTAGLDGDYNDIEGIFFGANGYESGRGYNQNQGFVLWTLVEHVYLSGDYDWFKSIMESVIKGCEWIINERKIHQENILRIKNQAFKENIKKNLVYEGLLPPGGVEDITDYWYWLSTNSYNAYGLLQAAVLLKQIQYKNADELLNEALEYFRQVRALFYGAMQDSPLIQLRNGTFIPHFPCHITRRGRGYGWIQETLEGAMHLIRCGIIPYWSKEAEWIIQDYEDNLYLSDKFGYPLNEDEFEKFWFNRGGFSMQPWLLCNHIIYLIRNQPKHYLRAFFNSFAVNYREDTKMFTEHPLPTMFDWFGQLYKTSDESNFINCLRAMIIQEGISSIDNISNINGVNQNELVKLAIEQYDSLRLFNCVPMEWFEHEKKIKLENIATFFGLVSLEFTSKIKYQQVDIALKIDSNHLKSLKLSNPIILKYIYVAIRLSDEKLSIKSVKIHDNMQNKDITKIDVKINHQTFEINLNSIITQSNCIDLLFKVIF